MNDEEAEAVRLLAEAREYWQQEAERLSQRLTDVLGALQEQERLVESLEEDVNGAIWNLEQCPSGSESDGGGFCNDVTRAWDKLLRMREAIEKDEASGLARSAADWQAIQKKVQETAKKAREASSG